MKSIIEALYHGQLRPDERIVPSHPEYRALSRKVAEQSQEWQARLGQETFRELDAFFDLTEKVDSIYIEAVFIHGFKLGANMMIEIMGSREDLTK
ncbi:DUF6809 family protein [Paenibacillus sp. RS8]|uniref:DUF6809 family protein n=1 Tax=Paenibacillus sp. RS8 TaxID=3242681 RepID=UPI0035C060FB